MLRRLCQCTGANSLRALPEVCFPSSYASFSSQSSSEAQHKDPEVEARKRSAVNQYLAGERAVLAQLLQAHGVLVKGGQEQAQQLLEALLAWKAGSWKPPSPDPAVKDTSSNSSSA